MAAKGRPAVLGVFSEVQVLSQRLEQRLLMELSEPIELVRAAPSRLVTLLRIVEREQARDTEGEATGRAAKGLRLKFFEKLEASIDIRFDTKLFDTLNSVTRFLHSFKAFFLEDLRTVRDELPHRFPPEYQIFEFYVAQYHSRLCVRIDKLQRSDKIDPWHILD